MFGQKVWNTCYTLSFILHPLSKLFILRKVTWIYNCISRVIIYCSVSCWSFTRVWVTASLPKFPGLSLLSILAVLNNAVVWMVSTRPPAFESSSPFSNPLVTVPNAPITIGIIVTCMFHSFFQFPSKVVVLILLFTFFQFYSVVSRDSKVDYFASSLCFCWLLLSLVFWRGLSDLFVC